MTIRWTRRHTYLALFIVTLVGASLLLQDVFDATVAHLAVYEETRPVLGPLLFVLLAAASVMLGPFTSAALMPFAVGVWGAWASLALLLVGWILGNAAAYGVGYHFGIPVVRRLVPKDRLSRWTTFLREKIDVWLLFLFRLAAPAEIGYVFGILKYHFFTYLVVVFAAELPFALILTFGGDAFAHGNWRELFALSAGAALITLGSLRTFNGIRKRRAGSGA